MQSYATPISDTTHQQISDQHEFNTHSKRISKNTFDITSFIPQLFTFHLNIVVGFTAINILAKYQTISRQILSLILP